MNTKQVIVIRKDLKMRRGKECAQAAHASMAFLTKNGFPTTLEPTHEEEAIEWIRGSFRKITCTVESEQELEAIAEKANQAGLICHIITDNGLTEFNGVPTKTCLAIGPHEDSKFVGVTSTLKLY